MVSELWFQQHKFYKDLKPQNTPKMTKNQEDLVMKDLMTLQTTVSNAICPRIALATSARDAWNTLEMEFQRSSQTKMKIEVENKEVFTEDLIGLRNQLRVYGGEKMDYRIIQKFLISLRGRGGSKKSVLKQIRDLTSLRILESRRTLMAHEERVGAHGRGMKEERINEGALYGKLDSKRGSKQGNKRHEKTKRWCGVCKIDNHNEVDCWRKKNGGVPQMSAKNERKCVCNTRCDKCQNKAEKWCGVCACNNHNESDCWKKQHGDVSLSTGVRCFACNKREHVVKNCKVRKTVRVNLSLEETNEESDNEGHMLFSAIEEVSSSNVNDET